MESRGTAPFFGASLQDAARQAANGYRELARNGKAAIIDPRAAWEY